MSIKSNIVAMDKEVEANMTTKRTTRQFTHSLEYEIIANLVLQQYQIDEDVRFELLWSIAVTDRIPALTIEYGKKRMHKLVVTLLKEFCISIPLPKTKKLNDNRINVCACDLMLSAAEEALSMEDFVLFFERVKKGAYGPIKKYLTHQIIREKLEVYLEERRAAFAELSQQKHTELKALGPIERSCEDPKQIGELLKQASVIEMNKKMSG